MIYFKQYGAQRSGTNYLKRLVELNFKDVTVFGSVLGWKHGMYEHANGYQFKCDSHEEWLEKKTKDGRVYSVDGHALKHTREELEKAIPQLNYLISVKDPYAYVSSFKKFRARKKEWEPKRVEGWVNQYLELYDAWKRFHDEIPGRCFIVNYNDLLTNRDIVLTSIQSKFGLTLKHDTLVDETRAVNASTDHGLIIDRKQFNKDYYLNKEYLNELPEEIIQVVSQTLSSSEKRRC